MAERLQEITPLGATGVRTREVPAAAEARPSPGSYVTLSLALQFALLASLAGGVYFLHLRFERAARDTQLLTDRAAQVTDRVSELTTQTEGLRTQVGELRSTLAAGTSEDVIFLKIMLLEPKIDASLARTIASGVHRNAVAFDKDPDLVLAIISVESGFNPKAVSSTGALGLMQVMPHWKKILNVQGDLTDPEVSIHYGLQVLGFYEAMYKDLETVLTAYNRGPGPVDKALMRNQSPRNDYAPRVLAAYERLRKLNVTPAAGR